MVFILLIGQPEAVRPILFKGKMLFRLLIWLIGLDFKSLQYCFSICVVQLQCPRYSCSPDKRQWNRKKFLPHICSFVIRKARKHLLLAKTVFVNWLPPKLFLILILVSTGCGFCRKLLHKMPDISKPQRSDSPLRHRHSKKIWRVFSPPDISLFRTDLRRVLLPCYLRRSRKVL